MADIKWTKTFELPVDVRRFRVFVSEHEGGAFAASCLWYEKGRALKKPGQPGVMQFHLEQKAGLTEAEALDALMAWVAATFPDAGELKALSE